MAIDLGNLCRDERELYDAASNTLEKLYAYTNHSTQYESLKTELYNLLTKLEAL